MLFHGLIMYCFSSLSLHKIPLQQSGSSQSHHQSSINGPPCHPCMHHPLLCVCCRYTHTHSCSMYACMLFDDDIILSKRALLSSLSLSLSLSESLGFPFPFPFPIPKAHLSLSFVKNPSVSESNQVSNCEKKKNRSSKSPCSSNRTEQKKKKKLRFFCIFEKAIQTRLQGTVMAKTKPGKKDLDSYTIKGTNKVVRGKNDPPDLPNPIRIPTFRSEF